jgi:hypothetical protein
LRGLLAAIDRSLSGKLLLRRRCLRAKKSRADNKKDSTLPVQCRNIAILPTGTGGGIKVLTCVVFVAAIPRTEAAAADSAGGRGVREKMEGAEDEEVKVSEPGGGKRAADTLEAAGSYGERTRQDDSEQAHLASSWAVQAGEDGSNGGRGDGEDAAGECASSPDSVSCGGGFDGVLCGNGCGQRLLAARGAAGGSAIRGARNVAFGVEIESPSSIASGESGREADGGPGEEDCSRSIGCKRGRDEGGNKTYEEAVLVGDGDHHVPVGVVG